MGNFVDASRCRVANSPVESYFNITKNITLEGKSKVVPSEYIRKSYVYIKAKLTEANIKYKSNDEPVIEKTQPKTIKLEEDVWRRTP